MARPREEAPRDVLARAAAMVGQVLQQRMHQPPAAEAQPARVVGAGAAAAAGVSSSPGRAEGATAPSGVSTGAGTRAQAGSAVAAAGARGGSSGAGRRRLRRVQPAHAALRRAKQVAPAPRRDAPRRPSSRAKPCSTRRYQQPGGRLALPCQPQTISRSSARVSAT